MSSDAVQTEEERFPSVGRAYDFVLPSYQLLVNRFEAADARLTNLATIASTVLLGLPVFGRTVRPDIQLSSPLLLMAIGLLIVSGVVATTGRMRGRLFLVNPSVLYRESLAESEWEFKKNAVFYAGKHFTANAATVDRKGVAGIVASFAILIALSIAGLWLAV